jgi:hypothetical protein
MYTTIGKIQISSSNLTKGRAMWLDVLKIARTSGQVQEPLASYRLGTDYLLQNWI